MLDFNDTIALPIYQAAEDPVRAMQAEMAKHNLAPLELLPDSKLHRFDVEKRGDKAGWYVLHLDGVPAGAFGCWQTGLTVDWCSKSRESMTPEQASIFDRHVAEMKRQRAEHDAQVAAEAAILCQAVWEKSKPAPADHPYLIKKRVGVHGGIKIDDRGRLLVPMCDIFGEVRSLQTIDATGNKLFWPGGSKKGNYFVVPGGPDVIICEGYSTAASLFEATGSTVVIAFDAGNLTAVAQNVRSKFGRASITIAADDDRWKPEKGNAGVEQAKKAAEAIGARVVIPEFKNASTRPTDFNDLSSLEGIEAVRQQVQPKIAKFDPSQWTIDSYQGAAPERTWLIKYTFPMAAVSLIAAMGDAGKGMILLDLALRVATGIEPGPLAENKAFGNDIDQTGAAVIFSAEDDQAEIHRRLESIDKDGRRFENRNLMVVPLPNAGGPIPIVTPGKNGPEASFRFYEVRDQLVKINNLKLIVFDPLASFVTADVNADPAAGAFTTGLLSSLATETGAAVIIAHHMGKGNAGKPIRSVSEARNMIRGTTALVDGVRAAYVLWPMDRYTAQKCCALARQAFLPNKAFFGALVKSNGPGDREKKRMLRNNENGLLEVWDAILSRMDLSYQDKKDLLLMDIEQAAKAGAPFMYSGGDGVWERSEELDKRLQALGRDQIRDMIKELLNEKEITRCVAKGSTSAKWLDVPHGDFAQGIGTIEPGGVMFKKGEKK